MTCAGSTGQRLEMGFTFHTSDFGQISHTAPHNNVRGGILAQDVGMGKTVEMLALIASTSMPGPTLVFIDFDMGFRAICIVFGLFCNRWILKTLWIFIFHYFHTVHGL